MLTNLSFSERALQIVKCGVQKHEMDLSPSIKEAQKLHKMLIDGIEKSDDARVDEVMPAYDKAVKEILAFSPRSILEFKLKASFILNDLLDEYEDDEQINLYCQILKSEIDDLLT